MRDMHWFRRGRDPVQDSFEETVLLEDEFEEVLATHNEAEELLFEAHGQALSRGDFAEAERLERRIDELKAERAALTTRRQAAQERVDKPSEPASG
jgi:hypothetical protein